MRVLLILASALGWLAAAYWGFKALDGASRSNGGIESLVSLYFFGSAVGTALLCGFGEAVLRRLDDSHRYLQDIRAALPLQAGFTQAAAARESAPGATAGETYVNPKYAPGPIASPVRPPDEHSRAFQNNSRQEPKPWSESNG